MSAINPLDFSNEYGPIPEASTRSKGAGESRTHDGGFAIGSHVADSSKNIDILPNVGALGAAVETPKRTKGANRTTPTEPTGNVQPAGELAPLEADLQSVVDAWGTLPDAIRAGIVAMVKSIKPGG